MNEWDSPERTRRLEWQTRREIPLDEFRLYLWYDVTSMSDPEDAHVYVRVHLEKDDDDVR
jgi:hypothetical protein